VDVADQMRIQNQGWGDSLLQAIYYRLRGLGESYLNLENILDEFIIGILTIDNLQELIANGKEALIQKRLTQIDLSKHIINSVLVDKDEKYERISATTTGLKDIMDVLIEGASAGSYIPVCLLMGRSVGGLGSEDASLVRLYYDHIKAQQEEDMLPQLEQLIRYINIAQKNVLGNEWKINFNPLWQPTQKDEVATRLALAQADQIYMMNGALLPEEVALARFGGDHYSTDMALSPEHQAELEQYKQIPDDSESMIADVNRKKEDTITDPADRLGVNKTTDLKTMALGFPKMSSKPTSSKSGQMGGATKDVIAKKQDSADGVDVKGIDLSQKGGLASLNLPQDEFDGYIDASKCGLTSITGLPAVVNGRLVLNGNDLKNLVGSPVKTEDMHVCSAKLQSLIGAPDEVTDFHVHGNNLVDLQGAPRVIKKDFHAYSNRLTTMLGAPSRIGGDFLVNDNNITTLEGLPRYIGRNISLKGNPIKTTEAEVRALCMVGGAVEL
jgi:hypothetical protein